MYFKEHGMCFNVIFALPGLLGSDWLGLAWLSSLSGSPGLHTPTVFVYLLQVVYAYSVSPITVPLLHH